ncbi:MAG: cyclic pyranopterin monophosphate synthase MoaC [Euryarchaeota archaeon]|nr:cyclic pyranopterin monophosphate synthase MoaC [Euryarchaeota archaeon]MDE1835315.1 cyclic pyranopterin monophosphate synthase MoaC [Euryarchaeota archaeon]MDE1880586.1 cyclic pyranopterin monophosphate synthase MoaC [Euryarchaeota archaeon]MDE2043611.1 cyclic pyranopterin monophosphate synthase MoaC [Thermoplasmata archaeon]
MKRTYSRHQGARRPGGGSTGQRSITAKPLVYRRAVVEGEIALSGRARVAMAEGTVEKGDPRAAAALAGMSAMKRTAELIPHCHIVPLTWSRVDLELTERGVRVRAEAEARWSTGVEMEALVGATVALLTVWDMVKYLEKDSRGQYPETVLGPVRVTEKVKGRSGGPR